MTVPIQDPIVSYVATGVTAGPFTFPFRILDADDLKVLQAGVIASPLNYVVSGIGDDEGSVTFYTLPGAGTSVILYRQVALERTVDYQFNGDLRAVTVNADFDRIWMALQDIGGSSTRAIQYPIDEFGIDGTLPEAGDRANKMLGFDASGFQTLLPLPSSLGAGDLRWELGSDGTPGFKAGVDFTPDVTTQLTLSRSPGNSANCWVYWGASEQTDTTVVGNKLNFPAPIPTGVPLVMVRLGTTLSLGLPAQQSVTDDSVAVGAGINADKLAYVPKWVGSAGPRIVTSKLDDIPDIRDCYVGGPVGTGNDDTAAMTKAHSSGLQIDYPDGTFIFSSFSMAGGGISGRGKTRTILQSFDTSSADLIKWTGVGQASYDGTLDGPSFEKFQINVPGTKSGGASLLIAPSTGEVAFFEVDAMAFKGGWTQLGMTSASHWNVRASKFLNFNQAGILVQNINNPDSGDPSVMGCTFNTNFASVLNNQAGILQRGGTNLKVTGNKFLGANWGYVAQMALAGVAGVAGLQFVGNSVENQAQGGMNFSRLNGTGGMGGVNITGNEFGLSPLHIVANDASGFLSDVLISSNTFAQIRTGDVGVTLDNVTSAYVHGNKFSGSTGTGVGISTGSNLIDYHQGINKFRNLGTPYGIGSPAQSIVDYSTQRGTATVTLNSAYGSLFSGSIVITFPRPFLLPAVDGHAFVLDGANSGVSCAVTSLTATQMVVAVFGFTNGATVPIRWDAAGTI